MLYLSYYLNEIGNIQLLAAHQKLFVTYSVVSRGNEYTFSWLNLEYKSSFVLVAFIAVLYTENMATNLFLTTRNGL